MKKLYYYRQNNSGGQWIYFSKELKLADLLVAANSEDEANEIAESYGVYFNGCEENIDCECCGDRWYDPTEVTDINDIYLFVHHKALIVDRQKKD